MQLFAEVVCKLEPFLLDRHGVCRSFPFGTQVPVGGVLDVALSPVEVGVNPCAVVVGQVLDKVVCLVPATCAGEPQRAQDFRQFRRGLGGLAGGLVELVRIHGGRSVWTIRSMVRSAV